eukprot:GHVU01136635.1.p1 GENE.GHVU01136635.1~~GHVU01136635.1.p1  ORF type:complete len:157 (-),score=21.93 GHVU01136635.1:226-696(-)
MLKFLLFLVTMICLVVNSLPVKDRNENISEDVNLWTNFVSYLNRPTKVEKKKALGDKVMLNKKKSLEEDEVKTENLCNSLSTMNMDKIEEMEEIPQTDFENEKSVQMNANPLSLSVEPKCSKEKYTDRQQTTCFIPSIANNNFCTDMQDAKRIIIK